MELYYVCKATKTNGGMVSFTELTPVKLTSIDGPIANFLREKFKEEKDRSQWTKWEIKPEIILDNFSFSGANTLLIIRRVGSKVAILQIRMIPGCFHEGRTFIAFVNVFLAEKNCKSIKELLKNGFRVSRKDIHDKSPSLIFHCLTCFVKRGRIIGEWRKRTDNSELPREVCGYFFERSEFPKEDYFF